MENNSVDTFESFKHSFLKVPRKVFDIILDVNHPEYTKMRIYSILLKNAYYSDGYVHLGRKRIVCHRGEYIGRYESIAKMSRLCITTVGRYARDLQKENLISIVHLKNALRFSIVGYDELCGVAPAPAEKKPSRAPRKKANEAPAPALATFQYGNNTRPVVYDDQGQIIMDGDEARRIVAERGKNN